MQKLQQRYPQESSLLLLYMDATSLDLICSEEQYLTSSTQFLVNALFLGGIPAQLKFIVA